MKTVLYLVRHAHSVYTQDERKRPLTKEGAAQATLISNVLSNYPIDLVLSSPYQRAIETVLPLAENLKLDMLLCEDLRERKLAAKPLPDFQSAIAAVWEQPAFAHPGGESNLDAQRRAIKAIQQIISYWNGKHIAIGTHGNIMALIMQYYDKRFDFSFWQALEMPAVWQLTLEDNKLKAAENITIK